MRKLARLLAGLAIFAFFVWAAGRAADAEFASAGGVLEERGEGKTAGQVDARLVAATPRSSSACGASSIGPSSSVPEVTHRCASEKIPLTATHHQKKPLRWWVAKARQNKRDANARGRTIRRLQGSLRHRWQDHSLEAIAYASTAYGVSYTTLRRKAHCETGGTFDPYAKNRRSTASGLFQFLTGTWASTPYARFSIWDPYANALAAGWMHARGRGGEWACR